jgi:hypothetical protein
MKNNDNVSYFKKALVSSFLAIFTGVFIFGLSSVFGATFPPSEVPPGGLTSPTFSGLTVKDASGNTSEFNVNGITFSDNEGLFYDPTSPEKYIWVPGIFGMNIHADDNLTTSGFVVFSGGGGDKFIVDPNPGGDVKIGNTSSLVNVLWKLNVSDMATIGKKLTVTTGGIEATNGGVTIKNSGGLNVSGNISNGTSADANPVVIDDKLTVSKDLQVTGSGSSGIKTNNIDVPDSGGFLTLNGSGAGLASQVKVMSDLILSGVLKGSTGTLKTNSIDITLGGLTSSSASGLLLSGTNGVKITTPLSVTGAGTATFSSPVSFNTIKVGPNPGVSTTIDSNGNIDTVGNLTVDGHIYNLPGSRILDTVKFSSAATSIGTGGGAVDAVCSAGYFPISCEYKTSGGWGFAATDVYTTTTDSVVGTGKCTVAGKNRDAAGTILLTVTAKCMYRL